MESQSHINLNGQWTFVIVYGPEYGEDENKELYFDGEFTQEDDTFTGTGKDTGGNGMSPDVATFNGFIDEDNISFVKQYAFAHNNDENGNVIVDKHKPGHEINYFGTYNKADNSFSGEWDIVYSTQQMGGRWFDESCTGTWSMKRNSEN